MPLYRKRYRLLTAPNAPLGDRGVVTWAEVAQVPLCLLTPDMRELVAVGLELAPD